MIMFTPTMMLMLMLILVILHILLTFDSFILSFANIEFALFIILLEIMLNLNNLLITIEMPKPGQLIFLSHR